MKYSNRTFQPTKEVERERFEFELTVNGNIICQRYFKMNWAEEDEKGNVIYHPFNEASVYSTDFYYKALECVELIKKSLLSKSRIYTAHMAPLIFNNEKEMRGYLFNADGTPNKTHTNNIFFGSHIILREPNSPEFVWIGNDVKNLGLRHEDEYTEFINEPEQGITFKFAIIDNGKDYIKKPVRKEKFATIWDGSIYPKFVRNAVDLSNGKKSRFDSVSSLSHDASLYYWCNLGQDDLIPQIVRNLRDVCTLDSSKSYNTEMSYGETTYNNLPVYFEESQPNTRYRQYSGRNKK